MRFPRAGRCATASCETGAAVQGCVGLFVSQGSRVFRTAPFAVLCPALFCPYPRPLCVPSRPYSTRHMSLARSLAPSTFWVRVLTATRKAALCSRGDSRAAVIPFAVCTAINYYFVVVEPHACKQSAKVLKRGAVASARHGLLRSGPPALLPGHGRVLVAGRLPVPGRGRFSGGRRGD